MKKTWSGVSSLSGSEISLTFLDRLSPPFSRSSFAPEENRLLSSFADITIRSPLAGSVRPHTALTATAAPSQEARGRRMGNDG